MIGGDAVWGVHPNRIGFATQENAFVSARHVR